MWITSLLSLTSIYACFEQWFHAPEEVNMRTVEALITLARVATPDGVSARKRSDQEQRATESSGLHLRELDAAVTPFTIWMLRR